MMTLRPLLLDSRDGEWGKGEPGPDRVGMRVIRGTDFESVRQGQVEGVPTRFLERRHADRKRLQPWDIILETAGGSPDRPTGRTMLVTPRTIELLGEDITCASFARFLRIDPTQADPAYLFWLLQHHYGCRDLLAFHTQHTGVARFQFTTFSNSFEFDLPPLETQRRIAGILGAYDDLIEVNRRRIAVLEEMARGLFTEWFTRLRFPGHEDVAIEDTPEGPLPAGWVIATLGELCSGKSGIQTGPFGSQLHQEDYADEGVPVVMPKNIINLRIETDGIARIPPAIANSLGRHLMVEGDVVYGRRGDIGRRALISRAEAGFFCGTGCLRLRPDTNKTAPRYLFMALGTPETEGAIKARATGATMPNLNMGVMQDVPVLNPPVAMQRKFDAKIGPIQESITNLVSSNAILAAARDLLLQRLISGQLSVAQAERELKAA